MQRSAQFSVPALGVELVGDLQRIGIEFDHGVDLRAGFVDRRNTIQVHLHESMRGQLAGGKALLQLGDGNLVKCECAGWRAVRERGGDGDGSAKQKREKSTRVFPHAPILCEAHDADHAAGRMRCTVSASAHAVG